ncbi:hypothetical protein [Mycoplasmopsis pulmonis]|nr:hypothetical protein [Mycoplasmopsis pulmonis]MDZ7293583.1 hypothetical protein [Mycoplasmopsis pulmonis]VEU68378.1 Uncharacterised protein [Mycoplasmopsis pulmonis]
MSKKNKRISGQPKADFELILKKWDKLRKLIWVSSIVFFLAFLFLTTILVLSEKATTSITTKRLYTLVPTLLIPLIILHIGRFFKFQNLKVFNKLAIKKIALQNEHNKNTTHKTSEYNLALNHIRDGSKKSDLWFWLSLIPLVGMVTVFFFHKKADLVYNYARTI